MLTKSHHTPVSSRSDCRISDASSDDISFCNPLPDLIVKSKYYTFHWVAPKWTLYIFWMYTKQKVHFVYDELKRYSPKGF